jgi:hypothetical protein
MEMQVRKNTITETRVLEGRDRPLENGEVRVTIDRFGYSANNVTYAAAGDTLKYWQFFPTAEGDDEWGIVPVWGLADITESRCEGLAAGERLFGYFPPAVTLIMQPVGTTPRHFIDGSAHRADLPPAYNIYRRVETRDEDAEDRHMLLFPLYVTSWALWDAMKEANWHGAQRVVLVSASSKTAIGLAYALANDKDAPPVLGLTSAGNVEFVEKLGLYDEVLTYDKLEDMDAGTKTIIVDMSGNAATLGRLHRHLGDAMRHTLDVGLTHWDAERRDEGIIRDRRSFFFAPAQITARTKEWGAGEFARRTGAFMEAAAADSKRWLKLERFTDLKDLAIFHTEIANGGAAPERGIIIKP